VRPPWEYEEPACAEVGTALFFQPDRDDPGQGAAVDGEYRYARQVCGTCPHRMECAEWGIANETHGMWGGLSPQERNKTRNRLGLRIVPKTSINYT
jgi:WhiB family redox-sensing transcriptional regulator